MIFPPGEWSHLLVGDQWPDDQDLMTLSHGKLNRSQIKTGFVHFADMLRNAQTGPLTGQQGHTADDLRDALRQGENQARQVADKNGIKEDAYGTAYDSTLSLQQDLTSLAEEGNKQIKAVQDSKEPVEARVTQIVAAIHQYRMLSNIAAAKYGGNVLGAMQRILDAEGTGQSARQFAQAHNVDVAQIFRPRTDEDNLEKSVRDTLHPQGSPMKLADDAKLPPEQVSYPPQSSAMALAGNAHFPGGPPAPAPSPAPASPMNLASNAKVPAPQAQPVVAAPAAAVPSQFPGSLSAPTSPPVSPCAPTASMPGTGASGPASPLTPTGPAQGLTPGELIHSFDNGLQNGGPFTAAANTIPPAPMSPTESQVPQSVPTGPAADFSAPAHAPVYESPPPVTHTPVPDASSAPPMMAGPATPAGPVSATPPTGPLPAYASDLRPTISAASTPAAPPSSPLSATPGSAPVHPSAGQGSPAQPAVVRQATAPAQPSVASSLGTQAVAATATGAVAGAASANATARARLQRLVGAVARQQPRLAWAIGDRADNTTVLATDLASGWIPPGIELPAGVTLLPPERRRGGLEILLGDVTVGSGYTPIHHIPDEDEPVPTSTRPRHVPEIDELGWELSQAVQWRDGLPRLALTLAKAASSGTGVLDKEVELLHEHLAAISTRILDAYPADVDTHEVGNWQLLAAIDALVAGDKSAANYHLAWFQACSVTAGQVHR